ncbi:MAG: hypothetical protein LVS60_08495 [Nodosilinea sp. LVE1205-7]
MIYALPLVLFHALIISLATPQPGQSPSSVWLSPQPLGLYTTGQANCQKGSRDCFPRDSGWLIC